MGSFRSPARLAEEGQATLSGPPLGEGEWIRYWAVLPHSVSARITSEATKAVVDMRGRVTATFDPGAAAMVRTKFGIVDWLIMDESGNRVPWDPERSEVLLDGLGDEVFDLIAKTIDSGSPKDLGAKVNEEDERSETVGEDLGGTSTPSSMAERRPPSSRRTGNPIG